MSQKDRKGVKSKGYGLPTSFKLKKRAPLGLLKGYHRATLIHDINYIKTDKI